MPSSAAVSLSGSGGKSIRLMGGGERTWIEACLTLAIALYLAQYSGRRYATLFSDGADGPLDPERKRMFMAMKREVLRLGGYHPMTPNTAVKGDPPPRFALRRPLTSNVGRLEIHRETRHSSN